MAYKDLVERVHEDLLALEDESIRHHESPRFIRLVKALRQISGGVETETETPESIAESKCLHLNIGPNGICKNCDAQVFKVS
jgi:hypothetical protein